MTLQEQWAHEMATMQETLESRRAFASELRMLDCCTSSLKDACTPRAPKPEWFDRWKTWWVWTKVQVDGPPGLIFIDSAVYTIWEESDQPRGFNGSQDGCVQFWRVKDIIKCLPVQAADWRDYPISVGFGVVGE